MEAPYVTPTDPLVAELVERLDASQREAWEERAAIMQFDGQLPRGHASAWRCSTCCVGIHRCCPASLSWRLNWMARNGC